MLPKPMGKRVGIATTSGALGVISTDLVVRGGLELATFEPGTISAMRTILPEWLEPANPFDFWISIDVKGPREAHEVGLSSIFADSNVDLVLCTLLAPANADFPGFGDLMKRLRKTYNKPVAVAIYGGSARSRWVAELEGADVPVFNTTREAARALSLLVQATC
jgi:acetyltransferase